MLFCLFVEIMFVFFLSVLGLLMKKLSVQLSSFVKTAHKKQVIRQLNLKVRLSLWSSWASHTLTCIKTSVISTQRKKFPFLLSESIFRNTFKEEGGNVWTCVLIVLKEKNLFSIWKELKSSIDTIVNYRLKSKEKLKR